MAQDTDSPVRRNLRFDSLDDILADAEALAARDPQMIRLAGKWSLGENLSHLASTMTCSLDGFPFKVPIPLRWILPLFKRHFLAKGFSLGFKLKGASATALMPSPDTTTQQGLDQLRQVIQRLRTEQPTYPSPVLGRMTRDQWFALYYRHAELHLSFIV